MDFVELKEWFNSIEITLPIFNKVKFIKKHGIKLYDDIVNNTDFLDKEVKLSERIYCILNDIKEIPKCPVCSKNVKFGQFNVGYYKHCSKKCHLIDPKIIEQIKENNILKYGTEYPINNPEIRKKANDSLRNTFEDKDKWNKIQIKKKETCNRIYGTDHPVQNKKIFNNIKNTNSKIYGVEYPLQNEEIKLKTKNTLLVNLGVDNVSKSEIVKIKRRKTNERIYGSKHVLQRNFNEDQLEIFNNYNRLLEIYQEHIKGEIPVDILSKKYGFSKTILGKYFKRNGLKVKRFSKSYQEKLIKTFLDELNIDYIQNDRKQLNRKELDFYIPKFKLAIEINGLYWHDERSKYGPFNLLDKHNLCKKSGIKLLHFWEFEVNNKFEIVKTIIKDNLGLNQEINVNDCIITEISQEESFRFYENNHILGGVDCDYNYGQYHENELISCIGINRSEEGYEIVRDCTKIGYNVTRRLDKLLSHIKNINKDLVIKLDKRLFNIIEYEEKGFKLLYETFPNIHYHKDNRLLYEEEYKLEKEIVNSNKWYKIYDCGHYYLKYNFGVI